MPTIQLSTRIKAPPERIFRLLRSLQAHEAILPKGNEVQLDGTTSRFLHVGDELVWKGKPFGYEQTLRMKITDLDANRALATSAANSAFRLLDHRYLIVPGEKYNELTEELNYESRPGILGKLINNLFLTAHLRAALSRRTRALKKLAESADWEQYVATDSDAPKQD